MLNFVRVLWALYRGRYDGNLWQVADNTPDWLCKRLTLLRIISGGWVSSLRYDPTALNEMLIMEARSWIRSMGMFS